MRASPCASTSAFPLVKRSSDGLSLPLTLAEHPDGTWVGRSAPEIDVIEAQVANGVGEVSLSAQWAPFDAYYE